MLVEGMNSTVGVNVKLSLNKALKLAAYHHKRRDLAKAERLYKAVLKAFPDNETARVSVEKISSELIYWKAREHEQTLVDRLRDLYLKSKMEEARSAARELISLNPDQPIAWSILGGAELALGNNRQAETAFRKLKILLPDDPNVANNLASALMANDKHHEAIEHFQSALEIRSDFLESYIGLAKCLNWENRVDEAVVAIEAALNLSPTDGRALAILGTIKMKQGKTEEAVIILQKAIASNVFSSDAHRQLSQLVKYEEGHAHIKQVEDILLTATLTSYERCQMHYTYAKIKEDLSDFEQSYHHYCTAGRLRKNLLAYNISQDIEYFEKIKSHFQKIREIRNIEWDVKSYVNPIFIVGMPRSGTSLLEQIISSHSQVVAAGELHYVGSAGKQLVNKNLFDLPNLTILRDFYLKKVNSIGFGAKFVTDKMPHNFLYIGIIKIIFPDAKIIHVKRDPGAVCWSNFQRYFPAPDLGYSFDINDVVKHYLLYSNLMNFWKDEFPEGFFEVDYDQLTINPEVHIRTLLSYLCLNWEDSCLAPHENRRIVWTASREQVKEKIYTGSSQAWKKFEPFLSGAFDALYT